METRSKVRASRQGNVAPERSTGAERRVQSASILRVCGLLGWSRVRTQFGSVPASLLRACDVVRAADNRPVRVRRVVPLALDPEFLRYHPGARPVLIPKGAIGNGLPEAEIAVAPDQPVAIRHRGRDRLVRARALVGHRGIDWANIDDVVYYRIETEEPAELVSEGIRLGA